MSSSRRLTYPLRLFLWLLGYSALLVGSFVVFQYHREKEFKAAELDKQLQLVNTYILTEMAEGLRPADIDLSEFQTFPDIRVSVISADGRLLYDSSPVAQPEANHLDREEIRRALGSGSGYAVRRHSESTGNSYFYSARNGGHGLVVRTAVPYSVSLTGLLKADMGFIHVMGVIAIVMCVLGYFATRRVGQHITRLNRFASNVENGAMISDTEPFPADELGDISNHIVRLYARLQRATAERDTEHRTAMREQLEKERIKKQLTNNINHELKTPVASIRICLETLLAHPRMDAGKAEQFLRRGLANTERLERLLTDVALLTRMDDGQTSIEKEPVDVAAVIASTVDDRRLIASARGIEIDNRVASPLMIEGNARLLETVFGNLIDNAVAYSGGSLIELRAVRRRDDKTGEKIVITLADNGCGIPSAHLPRIFERFYRIDKGRSRAAGGTGLGLSIVKNAVLFHGGSISASNLPTGGLLFRITLPAKKSAPAATAEADEE